MNNAALLLMGKSQVIQEIVKDARVSEGVDHLSTFGDKIKELRKSKNLSLKEVGKRGGLSHAYISQIENGKRINPTAEVLNKLAKGLGVPIGDLIMLVRGIDGPFDDLRKDPAVTNPVVFGNCLKSLRKSRGLSISRVGILSGVSQPYLSQIESGSVGVPSPAILRRLSDVYEVNYISLLIQAKYITEEEINEWMLSSSN